MIHTAIHALKGESSVVLINGAQLAILHRSIIIESLQKFLNEPNDRMTNVQDRSNLIRKNKGLILKKNRQSR